MYVYIYTYIYIYIYIFIYIRTHTHTHIYIYIYTHTHTCVCVCVYVNKSMCVYPLPTPFARATSAKLLSATRQLVAIPREADCVCDPATAAYVCVCVYVHLRSLTHALCALAFTQYCHYHYCMVYGIQKRGRGERHILRNRRAIVWPECGRCGWEGAIQG